jgi:uncharacterized protein with PQ loop repeat
MIQSAAVAGHRVQPAGASSSYDCRREPMSQPVRYARRSSRNCRRPSDDGAWLAQDTRCMADRGHVISTAAARVRGCRADGRGRTSDRVLEPEMRRRVAGARGRTNPLHGLSLDTVKIVDRAMAVAAVVHPLSAVPQISQIYSTHDVSGVSLLTWIFFVLVGGVFLAYAVVHHIRPLILTQVLWSVNDLLIVGGVLLYR